MSSASKGPGFWLGYRQEPGTGMSSGTFMVISRGIRSIPVLDILAVFNTIDHHYFSGCPLGMKNKRHCIVVAFLFLYNWSQSVLMGGDYEPEYLDIWGATGLGTLPSLV